MKNKVKFYFMFGVVCLASSIFLVGCNNYFKNDYEDNSPTSGKLKIYYDEGLHLHVKNQAATFESQYKSAELEIFSVSESEAVQALYSDSCEAIVISRLLNDKENKAFGSKSYSIIPTAIAKSGIALITNINTPLSQLSYEQVVDLLTKPFVCLDSLSNETKVNVIFDKNNSSVLHYLSDTVLKGRPFSSNCTILKSTIESINYVAKNKNTVAFIDFAWLSDVDDSITKANADKIKFIPVSKAGSKQFEFPNQSSFKLQTYPFTRTVYVIKKTGEFSLAKGFETFVAGPKGQTTFLKQGLLPAKQQERNVEVKMEPMSSN